VVIGGSVYYFIQWHKHARSLVKEHLKDLRQRPVWLFSSGPLDDSAAKEDIPPIKPVAKLVDKVKARGHVTFGGRLENETRGLPVGDWRDPEHVRRWAEQIHGELVADQAS
jgi:menaquinone-dependent protoporphyrinogen oxidase